MSDHTHKQSHLTIERAFTLIEQKQTEAERRLVAVRTAAEAGRAERAHARAQTEDLAPRQTAQWKAQQGSMQGVASRPAPPVFRSAWTIRIASTAAVLAIGIGIGNWLGKTTQSETPLSTALAPDASTYSPPGELQLRMDSDFEKIRSLRR